MLAAPRNAMVAVGARARGDPRANSMFQNYLRNDPSTLLAPKVLSGFLKPKNNPNDDYVEVDLLYFRK